MRSRSDLSCTGALHWTAQHHRKTPLPAAHRRPPARSTSLLLPPAGVSPAARKIPRRLLCSRGKARAAASEPVHGAADDSMAASPGAGL